MYRSVSSKKTRVDIKHEAAIRILSRRYMYTTVYLNEIYFQHPRYSIFKTSIDGRLGFKITPHALQASNGECE